MTPNERREAPELWCICGIVDPDILRVDARCPVHGTGERLYTLDSVAEMLERYVHDSADDGGGLTGPDCDAWLMAARWLREQAKEGKP